MDPKTYREEMLSQLRGAEASSASESAQPHTDIEGVIALIERAENQELSVKERLEAISQINRIAFDLRAFKDYNAQYDRVLKRLRSDPSSMVRRAAFERLALSMDHETRIMLQQSLSGEGRALIPDKMAATLLGMDDHASSRDVLRDVVQNREEAIRQVALRGLAADANSAPLLERIAFDKSEHPETRQVATLSLKVASPERFSELAKKLAVDEEEDERIRATAVSSLAHSIEALERAKSDEFLSQLDRVSSETRSRALKASIKRLKARTQ